MMTCGCLARRGRTKGEDGFQSNAGIIFNAVLRKKVFKIFFFRDFLFYIRRIEEISNVEISKESIFEEDFFFYIRFCNS